MKSPHPYKKWRLMPSFKPVEVEIVGVTESYWRRGEPRDSRGKSYKRGELFDSRIEAIKAGRSLLQLQQAEIDKRQAKVDAKTAALDKAEAAK